PLYERGVVDPWATPFLLSYGGAVAITSLAWVCRRRWPGLPAAWLAYVVILLPVLGIFQSGPQIAADRYTYLAGLGWAILAGASDHCRQALQIKPDSAEAHNNWGLALADQGKPAEAIEHYRQALQIKPDSAEAHNNWGLALANQGKLAEASDHFRQALQIKPHSAEIHTNLGLALAQQGNSAEASDHFRQALQINPDFAQARSSLLNAL